MADKGLEDVPEGECHSSAALRGAPASRHSAHAVEYSREHGLTHNAGQIESNYDETTDSFDAMELKPELLRGVYAYGFERPSAIQQRAIMPVIKGT